MFFNKYPYTDFHELNLDFLLKNYKMLLDTLKTIDEWIDTHEREYQDLKQLVDDIEVGNLPDAVYQKLYDWMQQNAFDIIGNMIKFITVSLNDNGYIVLTYPGQWREIIFNTTGYDINIALQPEYGHLCISY